MPAFVGLLLACSAKAGTLYFDNNGTGSGYGTSNGGTYSWDGSVWATATGGTTATAPWVAGSFARFNPTVTSYTVTVNADESMAGLYNTVANTLTIKDAGSGLGKLDIYTGDQGFLTVGGGTVKISAQVTGVGGLAPEGSGSIYLLGNNNYSGGTTWGYSGTTLVYFNNNNAFGTGPIKNTFSSASVAPLLSTGGTVSTPLTITLNNPFQIVNAATGLGAGFNFANGAYTPVVLNGDFSLAANNALIKNNGNSTAPLTLNGNLNGSGVVTLAGNNGGKIIVNGANPNLTGTVAIGASGGQANVTVALGTANTLAQAATLNLAGGTLDPGGLHHSMGSTMLNVSANSTIDFTSGAAEIDFANSASEIWTAGTVLNLVGWDPSIDALRFGTDMSGLTADSLAEIELDGDASTLGMASLDANGYLSVPEPSACTLLLGGLGLLWNNRRRTA